MLGTLLQDSRVAIMYYDQAARTVLSFNDSNTMTLEQIEKLPAMDVEAGRGGVVHYGDAIR